MLVKAVVKQALFPWFKEVVLCFSNAARIWPLLIYKSFDDTFRKLYINKSP